MRISDWSSDVCSSDLLKLRYADFRTITRARSVPAPILDGAGLLAVGEAILAPLLPVEQGIRLLGVTLSKFEGEDDGEDDAARSEEHTSELQSLMRISYAVFCLKKKKHKSIVIRPPVTTQDDNQYTPHIQHELV